MRSKGAESVLADRYHGDAERPQRGSIGICESFSAFTPILDDVQHEAKVNDVSRLPWAIWRIVRIPPVRLEPLAASAATSSP
jgi:hypothetical protein